MMRTESARPVLDDAVIPAYRTLDVEVRSTAVGTATVRLPASPLLLSASGELLPGALAVLADACCGRAVASALPAGGAALTAQLRVEFVRPLRPGQRWVEGRAAADSVDDDGGLARGEIVDEADQLLGVASLRLLKAPVPGLRPPLPAGRPSPLGGPSAVPGTPAPGDAQAGDAIIAAAPDPSLPADSPVGLLLGLVSRSAAAGRSAWQLRPPPGIANSFGMVHGGVLGLVAHELASDAQRSLARPGERLVPLDLVINYYRGVQADRGLVTGTAAVTHRGRRFVVAEGELAGPGGRPALRLSVGSQVRGARTETRSSR